MDQDLVWNPENLKKLRNMLSSAGCSLLRAEVFPCSLDVIYGGLGISKLQFFVSKNWKKISNFFSAVNFFQFLFIKTLERYRIQPKMLDPDPD